MAVPIIGVAAVAAVITGKVHLGWNAPGKINVAGIVADGFPDYGRVAHALVAVMGEIVITGGDDDRDIDLPKLSKQLLYQISGKDRVPGVIATVPKGHADNRDRVCLVMVEHPLKSFLNGIETAAPIVAQHL